MEQLDRKYDSRKMQKKDITNLCTMYEETPFKISVDNKTLITNTSKNDIIIHEKRAVEELPPISDD